MPRPHRFPFFPHLAVITAVSLCCWMAGDSAAGPYLNSAHGGLNGNGPGVDRASISSGVANGNCVHCHEQHASIGGSQPAPVNAGPSNFMLFDNLAGNAACNYCHNGSTGADDIAAQIAKASRHNPYSVKVTAPATLWCTNCHESHLAQNGNHTEATGSNLIAATSPLLGATGVSLSVGWPLAAAPGAGLEAFSVPGLNAPAPLTAAGSMEYELCIKCHGGQTASYNVPDIRLQINPNNSSAHPIDSPGWKNGFLNTPPNNQVALANNWALPANLNNKMYCSDCHGSETGGDPAGPHGSTNPYILKAGNYGVNIDALCLRCHQDPGLAGNSVWYDPVGWAGWAPAGANPRTANQIPPGAGPHALAVHRSAAMGGIAPPVGPANPAGCVACHGGGFYNPLASSIHGANYLWPMFGAFNGCISSEFLLPDAGGAYITQNYYNQGLGLQVAGNRRCVAACHANAPWAVNGYLY